MSAVLAIHRPDQQQTRRMASSPLRPASSMIDDSPPDTHKSTPIAPMPPSSEDSRMGGADSPSDGRSSQPSAPISFTRIEIKTERPPSPSPIPPMTGRRRPQKLDLNTTTPIPPGRPSAPLTAAKESGGLSAMHEVATACLSPGFDTSNPLMRNQVERSKDLAEQQRILIAQRQNKGGIKDREVSASKGPGDLGPPPTSFSKPLGTSRRKAPPSMLSLNAAAANHYNEPRVIQSAPLGQTFTGLNRPAHPLSRQVLEHSHQQHQQPQHPHHNPPPIMNHPPSSPHVPTPQSARRLPPISDLVRPDSNMLSSPRGPPPNSDYNRQAELTPTRPSYSQHRANSGPTSNGPDRGYAPTATHHSTNSPAPSTHLPDRSDFQQMLDEQQRQSERFSSKLEPMQSSAYPPNHASQSNPHPSHRHQDQEPRLGDEIVQSIEGHEEQQQQQSRLIHYGGRQPPTPNSPLPPIQPSRYDQAPRGLKVEGKQNGINGRRRTREEYEQDHDAADADERDRSRERRRGDGGFGFGFGTWSNSAGPRHSPETMRRKKEEFMTICSRAWDLLRE